MKVYWTPAAAARLREIERHIAKDRPDAARAMVVRLIRRSLELEHAPLRGKRLPKYMDANVRELLEPALSADLSCDASEHRNRYGDALPATLAQRR